MTSASDKKKAGQILSTLIFVSDFRISPPDLKATWNAAITFLGGTLDLPSGMTFNPEQPKEALARIESLAGAASIREILRIVGDPRTREDQFGKLRDEWRLPLWAAFAYYKDYSWDAVEKAAKERQKTHGR